jgi:hypothetical protein
MIACQPVAERRKRPMAHLYGIEGTPLTLRMIHAALPHIPYDTLQSRLKIGMRTWEKLGAPVKGWARCRVKREPVVIDWSDIPPPCPLNAQFRGWAHTSRGRALNLLDVRTDPLRAAL